MAKRIFVNLPVKDLKRSMDFFDKLGFTFNLQFTDEKAACLVINEPHIYTMLLTEDYFKTFTKKKIADASKSTEVLIAIDAESRQQVDDLVKKAAAGGGSVYAEAKDHGWMYQHSFADPDGHQWEIIYIDETAVPQG
jgi:predicted lactoylglutathione lyase